MHDTKLIRVLNERDKILELLRDNGMHITKQRKLILDVVFEHECTTCKEIYYQVSRKDKSIGIATVYRMVNVLTDLGIFQANTPYRLCKEVLQGNLSGCRIVLKNQIEVELRPEEWRELLGDALARKGYSRELEIDRVILV